MRRLVHLKIGDQTDAAHRHVAQHDFGIAVAEIQRARQCRRAAGEMAEQGGARLAPMSALPQLREIFRSGRRGDEQQDKGEQCETGSPGQ